MTPKKNYKKVLLASVCLSFGLFNAQEQSKLEKFFENTEVSASVDMYYRSNFDNQINNLTSFTNSNNSFELGMASIKAVHTAGKASATIDIGFGKRADEFSFNSENSDAAIKQLFIDYSVTDKLTLTVGSWATHIGYELVDAADNDIYSMSYGFSYGPFAHSGIKASYDLGKGFDLMAGVANPTDFKSASDFDNKFVIWHLGYNNDDLSLNLGGQHGSGNPNPTNISQIDATGTYHITEAFKFGFDGTYVAISSDINNVEDASWMSLVGYLGYAFNDKVALNYRFEFLDDQDGVITSAIDNSLITNTLSLNYTQGNFQLKPEIRLENASEAIFLDADANPSNVTTSVLVGLTYSL